LALSVDKTGPNTRSDGRVGLQGYEGLVAAQECLPTNDRRDAFGADFSVLARIWEAVSPDPILTQFEKDYRWLVQVYESLKP
jgi:type I restriction enzyme R subunit